MALRPRSQQSALKPFLTEEGKGGVPAQSDSGGASFLGQVKLGFISYCAAYGPPETAVVCKCQLQ